MSIALLISLIFLVANLGHSKISTFRTFYYASQALLRGTNIYLSHAPGEVGEYVYPPFFAFLTAPLAGLQIATADRLWLVINLVVTWSVLYFAGREIVRRFSLPASGATLALLCGGAFLLSLGEIKTEWSTGQTDTLILLAFCLGLRWMDRWPVLGGIALGFGANIKFQPLFSVPWLCLRGRWKMALATLFASLGFGLLPATVSGWERNLQGLKSSLAGLAAFAGRHSETAAPTVKLTWIRSVSITSAFGRLLEFLQQDPSRAFLASAILAGLVLGIVTYLYRRFSPGYLWGEIINREGLSRHPAVAAVEWVGLTVAWLSFGPEVSRRHMFILLLLHLVVVAILLKVREHRRLLVGALIFWQLALRLPPSSPPFAGCSAFWNGVGGPGWSLLIFYLIVLRCILDAPFVREARQVSDTPLQRPISASPLLASLS